MENLELYEKVRSVPDNAKKTITGGRLNGMTDINPMWRIKTLTEQFGVCGIGWKPEIVRTWLDNGANGEISANVEIKLYVKVKGQWSEGIPGVGGSMFVSKEKSGLYVDDECYKKAYTDALSVACKALGIGADVYFAKDSTKYDSKGDGNPPPSNGGKSQSGNKAQGGTEGARQQTGKSKYAQVVEIIKDSELKLNDVTDWIVKQFGSNIRINNLTDEQFNTLMKALRKYIKEEGE